MVPLEQHLNEIQKNRQVWERKALLRRLYDSFYDRIVPLIDPEAPGLILEIGAGLGNLKQRLPQAVSTDLFPNPWLDLVCDGYELPFRNNAVSHIVAFDVFHHLRAPRAFLREARRVLAPGGKLILFEPYISCLSFPVYALLHHEPVAWRRPIDLSEEAPATRDYYAAQGNATRLFFNGQSQEYLRGWEVSHAEAFSAWAYLLSGGYSRKACYPENLLSALQGFDRALSRWARVFGGRCLVMLQVMDEAAADGDCSGHCELPRAAVCG